MPEINLPTKATQDAIKTNVDNVNTNVTSVKNDVAIVKTNVATVNTNVNTLNTNVGTPTSSASSSTSGNAHAKLNWLLTNLQTLVSGRVVKSIQRGMRSREEVPDDTVSISTVDVSKTIVLLDGRKESSNGAVPVMLRSLSSTSFTVTSNVGGTSRYDYSWQVIEFY
ncbi:hypothetical protein FC756_23270 [Lysinibacillus mangiferihumi]|uniref:Uncharacterized protein n=1 Tax=Lysinibacillus mangiferihumi TaxID=1130819 RepID=A0A4U2XZU3_9BACI|nr:hypothetical protein [Lysinibacillus mangiferihumi]TKI53550.1 hypothetical protein FC756_23270 [Lysinibacillus mangiferihumi]